MPPRDKGEAVPKDKAAVIAQWIKEGAKLDAGLDAKADITKELRVRWKPPAPPKVYPFPAIVNALAFTPDGKQLVVGGHHELTVWEIDSGKLVKRIYTRAERAYAMSFLPDGKLVVAGGRPGQEGDVRVYDLAAKGKTEDGIEILDGVNDKTVLVKHLFDVEDSVLCLAISADGKTLVAGGCDRAVRVFDLSDGLDKAKLAQTVENHADWVLGCTLTADGKYLVTAGRDKTAKVWDLKAKESVVTFPEHQNIVYGVAVKADGSAGFSVGADKNIRTWKPNGEGKQVKAVGGHGDEVFKIVASPKQADARDLQRRQDGAALGPRQAHRDQDALRPDRLRLRGRLQRRWHARGRRLLRRLGPRLEGERWLSREGLERQPRPGRQGTRTEEEVMESGRRILPRPKGPVRLSRIPYSRHGRRHGCPTQQVHTSRDTSRHSAQLTVCAERLDCLALWTSGVPRLWKRNRREADAIHATCPHRSEPRRSRPTRTDSRHRPGSRQTDRRPPPR